MSMLPQLNNSTGMLPQLNAFQQQPQQQTGWPQIMAALQQLHAQNNPIMGQDGQPQQQQPPQMSMPSPQKSGGGDMMSSLGSFATSLFSGLFGG